jgi:hypothetical protein
MLIRYIYIYIISYYLVDAVAGRGNCSVFENSIYLYIF